LRAHALPAGEVARTLGTDLDTGLSAAEAAARLARYGPNQPRRARYPPYAQMIGRQLLDPLVLLLVGATAVSIAHGPLATVALGAAEAAVCGILALVPLAVVEAAKALRRPRRQSIAQARPFAAP
jgi:P-type Ca2+ transporter type 2C